MYINPKTLSNQSNPAPGLILLTEEQEAIYIQHNGHVIVTEETDEAGAISYKVEPNKDAWEAWKASQPDPAEAKAAEVRSQRDGLLRDCDWTQMPDSPYSANWISPSSRAKRRLPSHRLTAPRARRPARGFSKAASPQRRGVRQG